MQHNLGRIIEYNWHRLAQITGTDYHSIVLNGILNPVESRCDALADFCLGLFLSLECHGCTKFSEACQVMCHVKQRDSLSIVSLLYWLGRLVELRFCLLTLYLVTHTFVTEAKLGCNVARVL